MISEILKKIEHGSFFECPIFDGLLHVRGRILSPAEIEQASLASTLILQSFGDHGTISKIQKLSAELSKEEPDQSTIDDALSMLQRVSPQQLQKVTDNQDKILIQCIKQARKEDSSDWEEIKLVQNQELQDSEKNILWIGMISKADRSALLDKIMAGHREAVERLATFRR